MNRNPQSRAYLARAERRAAVARLGDDDPEALVAAVRLVDAEGLSSSDVAVIACYGRTDERSPNVVAACRRIVRSCRCRDCRIRHLAPAAYPDAAACGLCPECHEAAGVENAHTDGAHVPTEHPECPICADVTERAAEARMTDGDI